MTGPKSFHESFIRWVCDIFVVVCGLWTILCHLAVYTHSGFSLIVRLSPLVPLLAALILYLLARARRKASPTSPEAIGSEDNFLARIPAPAGLAGAAALAFFFVISRRYILFWSASCLFLGYFFIRNFPSSGFHISRPPKRRFDTVFFIALLMAALALTLFLHRPDTDDSFYLSIPARALESPDTPLFTIQDSTGLDSRQILPTFSVHSVELAAGMLARLLGVRPITAAHLILPAIFALVFVCAAARLLRILIGGSWLWGLAALLFVLTANGDIHWSYGNFSLVRLFQGKSLLVSGVVPLLAAYSLEYMSGATRRLWPLLFLGQVSGLGLNSAGLYVGPIVSGFSLLGAWHFDKKSSRRLVLGALAACYPLAMGVWLRFGPMLDNPGFLERNVRVPAVPELLDKIFGSGVFFWVWLTALLGGWTVFRDAARKRWVLFFSLAYLLLFLNPFLNVFWSRNLLGVETMWRILWAVPLPVWLAVLLAALSGTAAAVIRRPRTRPVAFLLLLVLFGVLVPARWTLSRDNRTEIRWPSWKVPLEDYHLSERVAALTDPGRTILAPEEISVWIPTISAKILVLVSREFVLVRLRNFAAPAKREDISRRLALFHYISGTFRGRTRSESREMLLQAIDDYRIQSVVIPRSNPWRDEIETALRGGGFQKISIPSRKYFVYKKTGIRPG